MSPSRWFGVVAMAGTIVAGAPGRAQAFCGFFVAGSDAKLTNNASQVVLMRKGYIIRHYWDKPVACKDPHYDQWGGPPGDPFGTNRPTAAKNLAMAPRGKLVLRDEVRSPVPSLGITDKPPRRRKAAEK